MFLSIVVLTYQRVDSITALLADLCSNITDPRSEIIVVDNGSTDGTAAAVARDFPQVKLIPLTENTGVGGRNEGLAAARGEVAITLDDDMLGLRDEDLAFIRRKFTDQPDLAGLCFKVTWPGSTKVRDWVHRRKPDHCDSCFPTYEITEGAVAYRLSVLNEVGFYRRDFFISHEGVELAFRILKAGGAIEYDGGVSLEHHHAAGGRTSWRRYYFDTRNMFWVAILHHPLPSALRYLFVGTGALFVYSLRDLHLLAYLRGVWDGIWGSRRLGGERQAWSDDVGCFIAEVDSWRPGFWTMARKRLFEKNFSME